MKFEKNSFYVKIYNEQIKNCGTIDCGCIIEKVESPYVTLKLCKTHEWDVKRERDPFKHISISPKIENPEKFEAIHLAAIGSKSFD